VVLVLVDLVAAVVDIISGELSVVNATRDQSCLGIGVLLGWFVKKPVQIWLFSVLEE